MLSAEISGYTDRGIISPQDLSALRNKYKDGSLKIIDATFLLPDSQETAEDIYNQKHIPGALFFDLKRAANTDTSLPNMLLTPPDFDRILAKLGISADDFIVIYGSNGMVMGSARLWWMFRIFGHKNIAVLDGGLPAWIAKDYPTESGPPPESTHRGQFKSEFNEKLIIDLNAVLNYVEHGNATIIDARPPERFSGKTPEPRPDMRCGHIPNSINIPAKSLINPETGMLKTKKELSNAFPDSVFLGTAPIITTCGSGITACFLALALYFLDKKNVRVYDGSWSEWGAESTKTPISTTKTK